MSGEFELILQGIKYSAKSNHSSGDKQNWDVSTSFSNFSISITVPLEKGVKRSEVMVFIEAFHESFMALRRDQRKELQFLNN